MPDPTTVTSNAVAAAKDELRREIAYVEHQIDLRLEALDKAGVLLEAWRETVPTLIHQAIMHQERLEDQKLQVLRERFRVMDEKFTTIEERFRGIATSFHERDARLEQAAQAAKDNIDKALESQREMGTAPNTNMAQALARIEATAQRQIDQVGTLLHTTVGALDGKITDMKDRLTLIEGRNAGIGSSWGVIIAAITVLIGIGGLLLHFASK